LALRAIFRQEGAFYMNMKRKNFAALVIGAAIGLLALAGCDDALGDDGIWLDDVANPFIGTWTVSTVSMMGITTTTTREFKTDGTIAVTTKQGDNDPAPSTAYYLVKDDFLVISAISGSFYTKYRFRVIDNNHLEIVQDAGSATHYTRSGAENPNANRTLSLSIGIAGCFRSNMLDSSSTMYDWHTFKTDGTFHVYHWMNNDPYYIDWGEHSYYIDGDNRFVSITNGYTVRVYTGFSHNTSSDPNSIGWNDGSDRTFNAFDGETFTIP
jgi:hypothetical protein